MVFKRLEEEKHRSAAAEAEAAHLQRKLESQTSFTVEAEKNVAKLRRRGVALDEHVVELQLTLEEKTEEAEKQAEKMRLRDVGIRRKIDEIETQLVGYSETIMKLRLYTADSTSRKDAVEKELDQVKLREKDLIRRVDMLLSQLHEQTTTENDLGLMQLRERRLKRKIEDLQLQINVQETLENDLGLMQLREKGLKKKIDDLQLQLKGAAQQEGFEDEMSELRLKLDVAEAALRSDALADLKDLQRTLEGQERELGIVKTNLKLALQREIELQNQIAELELQPDLHNRRLASYSSRSNAEKTKLKTRLKVAETALRSATLSKNTNTQREMDALKNDLGNMKRNLSLAQQREMVLKKHVVKLELNLDSQTKHSANSNAGRQIRFAGETVAEVTRNSNLELMQQDVEELKKENASLQLQLKYVCSTKETAVQENTAQAQLLDGEMSDLRRRLDDQRALSETATQDLELAEFQAQSLDLLVTKLRAQIEVEKYQVENEKRRTAAAETRASQREESLNMQIDRLQRELGITKGLVADAQVEKDILRRREEDFKVQVAVQQDKLNIWKACFSSPRASSQ